MSYETAYIDIPELTKPGRVGRAEMSKTSTTNEAPKASKKYQKTRGEHAKDILIAILITGVVAFIGGMQFANKQAAKVEQAVKAAQVTAPVATAPASK